MIYFIKNRIFPNMRTSLRPRIYMNLCFFKYLYFYTKQADLPNLAAFFAKYARSLAYGKTPFEKE